MSGYSKVGPFVDDTTPAIDAAFLNGVENHLVEAKAYGPNWVAASDAPAAIKTAVLNGGGTVCNGTNDHTDLNNALASFKTVWLTEGTFFCAGTVTLPAQKSVRGQGVGTAVRAVAGITGAIFSTTGDHTSLMDLLIDGDNVGTSVHAFHANVTSNAGFLTGSEACTVVHNVVIKDTSGDGIRMEGTFNRDAKISKIHCMNAGGVGFNILSNTPDGMLTECVSGSSGSHGFVIAGSNWKAVQCKSWFSDGDGFWLDGTRCTCTHIEAQDNELAGIRITGNLIELNSWLADSNSWISGNANADVHSGLEIGRTSAGGTSGGFTITVGPGQSYDKNEGSRGFAQRSGVRCRTGVRRLVLMGVNTGEAAGSHHNVTAGIEFDTPADQTHESNLVHALSHGLVITD